MALNEITKGMSNAAEMINENFKNVGIVESVTNDDGSYIELGDGTILIFGTKSFVKDQGWVKGDVLTFTSDNLPIPYKKPLNIIYSEYNASLYDGRAGFTQTQVIVSKISNIVGSAEVTRNTGDFTMAKATSLIIYFFLIGKKK